MRRSKRRKPPILPVAEHLQQLPELPNELWILIVRECARENGGCPTMRLVNKQFSRYLERTLYFQAIDDLFNERRERRTRMNERDQGLRNTFQLGSAVHNRNIHVRLSEAMGDRMMQNFYLQLCSYSRENFLVPVQLLKDCLRAFRETLSHAHHVIQTDVLPSS